MRLIVTHHNPDLDAITSVWMIKKFLPDWKEAEVKFVPAGETLDQVLPDRDPNILHVDTGLGKLDHHQLKRKTCSAKLVLNFIKKSGHAKKIDKALTRLVDIVCDFDHFQEVTYSEPTADYWGFLLPCLLDGWRTLYPDQDQKNLKLGMNALEGIHAYFKNRVKAEKELKGAFCFKTKWGKVLALISSSDEVLRLAQKKGFAIAARKDPKKNYIKIKARPDKKIDLTPIYKKLKAKDPFATWFLHIDKKQLLNGSTKNVKMKPTNLSLEEIIKILKNS